MKMFFIPTPTQPQHQRATNTYTLGSQRKKDPMTRLLSFLVVASFFNLGIASSAPGAIAGSATFAAADLPSAQNVAWDSPGGEMASMPVGNGDVAGNVWVEANGDVVFYIAKSDAWNEQDRLLKVGRVRVSFEPALDTANFKQTLDLQRGEVVITAGTGAGSATVRVWADANHPVMRIACESTTPRACAAKVELWRKENQPHRETKEHSEGGLNECGQSFTDLADTVMSPAANRIGWFHRNTESIYDVTLKTQHLGPLVEQFPDPLLNRTFGTLGFGSGMTAAGSLELKSTAPATGRTLDFVVLTAQTPSAEVWREKAQALADGVAALDAAKARAGHEVWWESFWNRSYVYVSGNRQAEAVTRGYTLQRFMIAASSRGAAPPKFNGGLFTVQMPGTPSPDYRMWGGNYWFQNNRWLNWPSLATGDYDLMLPFFNMYRAALPLAEARTQLIFGHDGAFFPETMHFWGTHNGNDFHVFMNGGKWKGWNNPEVLPCNPYVKYYWQSGIELSAMMLDYYDHTQDGAFACEVLLPLASSIATFYDRHWKRNATGKIRFDPTASLETWHVAVNDAPTIAGLNYILPRLLEIPGATDAQKAAWRKTLADLPPLPRTRLLDGSQVLAPAETYDSKHNRENPQLYSVFPYRLYGVGKPEMQLARDTFNMRFSRELGCWTQNGVHAAMLGLADEARDNAIHNFSENCAPQRFPAFWPAGADWTPDLDNGGTAMVTLQRMLMQEAGDKILLLPAWPKDWNVEFKLHAPQKTVVECVFRDGKVTSLKVTPESRRKSVEVYAPFETVK